MNCLDQSVLRINITPVFSSAREEKQKKMTANKFEMKVVTMMIMMIDDFKNTNDEHNSSYDNGDVDNNSDNDNDEN